jgi:hypothetical protein
MFGYAQIEKNYKFLYLLVGGIFSLFLLVWSVSGVRGCCNDEILNILPLIVRGGLIGFYAVVALGMFVLSSIAYKDADFKGGF